MDADDLVEDIRGLLKDKPRRTELELRDELGVTLEDVQRAVDRLAQEGEVELFGGDECNNHAPKWRRLNSKGRRS